MPVGKTGRQAGTGRNTGRISENRPADRQSAERDSARRER